ncbi:MAG TPA: TatD family hydrolase [Deltaproteobacteria bacterium]|nr:TatD family hydrolase [Deltaproteobacteria bacterium]
MVIDCHYHWDERILPREALFKKVEEGGIEKVALMGIICDPFPEPAPFLVGALQMLLANRTTRGIGRALSAQFTPEGDIKILGKAYHIYPDPDNAPVFQAVKDYPERFLGWVFVNPRGKNDPVRELEKWQGAPGFIGVKAHSFWHRYAPIELAPVAEKVSALKKPLILHAGFGAHGDFMALLDAVPDLKLILAHAAFPEYGDTWKTIRHMKNVFVDLSQTSYVGERATRDVVAYLGVERCLYGTDGPYGLSGRDGRFDYDFLKNRLKRIFPDRGVQDRLLSQNFMELAGIKA